MIAKGGDDGNVDIYPSDTFGDTHLVTPTNPNNGSPFGLSHVEFCTDGVPETPQPGIDLEKTALVSEATAGSPAEYEFAVTNTGNVAFSQDQVVLTDSTCDSEPVLVDGDDSLAPGEVWTCSCVATIPADAAGEFVNEAELCVPNPGEDELCDSDTTTVTIPPVTPPLNPPVNSPPGGGELPDEVVSGRAQLRGPSGCVKQAFRARVSGRANASVTFVLDGKRIKRITGERSVYSVKIRPNSLRFGRHRVVARVQFTAESETASRRLPLTFRRCGRGAVAPRFTG